ncbi:copine-9 isoform X4 [Oryctolagus cuniculus]|uniref:copine-9 isoform X4 n=1 Tax=Oryctolagus cuniculus TaxID=9986 RepID=UPI00387A46ED
MGRGPPAGPGGAVLPSGAAAASGHCQGASGGSARRAGGSAAAAAAATHGPAPRSPLALRSGSQPSAAPVARPAMSLSGASERSVPATKIEITVSCRNLLDLDTFSKSDPMVVLYTQSRASQEWREFGRTEVIDNTLNPDFVRKFVLDYFFEEKQNLRFDVYNVDSKTNISKPVSGRLSRAAGNRNAPRGSTTLLPYGQTPALPSRPCPTSAPSSLCLFPPGRCWRPQKDFLGQAFLALGEVIGGQGSRVERPLTGVPGKKCGTILLTAEELSNCRDIATMQLCANKLDKKDFFGKSDPFLVFYRSNEDGTFTICHKTEVVKNTLNPVWQPFSIPVRALCNGDYDRTVKIDVYDWDRDGSHDFIGEFTTSYRELSKAQNQFTVYEVLNPRKKCKKKKYVNSGTVTLLSFSVDSEFTFVDYIKGGTQLNFTVAIDFTASNGNPLQPTSLHYMSPYQLSAYAMALKAVGEIIQDYDSDKLFPAYGFGAKLPPEGRISHQFPLNNNDEDPSCAGIEGVLESYFQSLRTVQLYGPTYFAPVINQVARAAAKISDGSQYYVLLIITDGVISDMTQTKEAIVSASSLPMSIIIVGVGPAMFEAMEELDGDDVRVSSRGRYAERDIVQFVPFRDYVDRSGNQVLSMARLAKDVLAEIPEQLLSYMRTRDIQPRPPPPAGSSPAPAPAPGQP